MRPLIRRPLLWPLAVTVLSLDTLHTPGGGHHTASVYVTATATVVPSEQPGFLDQAFQPSINNSTDATWPGASVVEATGQAELNAEALTKAEDVAEGDDHESDVIPAVEEAPLQLSELPEPRARPEGMSLQSLLESNSSVDSLLELSDEMLANATKLLATAAKVDALQGKKLFPHGALQQTRVAQNGEAPGPKLRHREEETIKELALHSGKLQKMFQELETELVEDNGEAEDSLDAHGPDAHVELSMAGIDETMIANPSTVSNPNLRVASHDDRKEGEDSKIRLLITGLLVACLLSVAGVGLCIHTRLLAPANRPELDDQTGNTSTDGTTSYVIRIVKCSINDLPSRTALSWQIGVGAEKPRPSRFSKDNLWDAPVDRLDVDVQDPREKISLAVLAASDALEPPSTLATVEVPAAVLLAEARGNSEKVKSTDDGVAFVHKKTLALYPRGEIVLEYSLIAFFHWYVGGEKDEKKKGSA